MHAQEFFVFIEGWRDPRLVWFDPFDPRSINIETTRQKAPRSEHVIEDLIEGRIRRLGGSYSSGFPSRRRWHYISLNLSENVGIDISRTRRDSASLAALISEKIGLEVQPIIRSIA